MGSLPAPHILEFLNGYCERDGLSPDAVREARIASERDARRVGYVRSILERWVERGVRASRTSSASSRTASCGWSRRAGRSAVGRSG